MQDFVHQKSHVEFDHVAFSRGLTGLWNDAPDWDDGLTNPWSQGAVAGSSRETPVYTARSVRLAVDSQGWAVVLVFVVFVCLLVVVVDVVSTLSGSSKPLALGVQDVHDRFIIHLSTACRRSVRCAKEAKNCTLALYVSFVHMLPLQVHPSIARFLIQRSSCPVQDFTICKKQKPDKTARKHGLGSYPGLATFSLLYPFSVLQFCRYEMPTESSSEFLFTRLNSGEFACVLC